MEPIDIESQQNKDNIPNYKPCSPLRSPDSISTDQSDGSINNNNQCPICLEDKENFIYIVCGHKVCRECNTLLQEHGCLNKCPICRCPLNWVGYVEFDGNAFVLRSDTPRSVITSAMSVARTNETIRNIIIDSGLELENENGNRQIIINERNPQQRQRELERIARIRRNNIAYNQAKPYECLGNVLCAVFVIILILIYGLAIASN